MTKEEIRFEIVFLIFLVALLYFIFMVLGNTRRYLKVKHLEKSLK